MLRYETFGAFGVPRTSSKQGGKALDFSKDAMLNLWSSIDDQYPNLSQACGCYIFAFKAGRGVTPWYVGQSKGPFVNECFQFHKQAKYNEVQKQIKSGTPILILVARLTPGGKFSKSVSVAEATFVERLLISLAYSKNDRLLNIKDTRLITEMQIPGILNSPKGKPSTGASLLRSTLR